jgi:polar amino acid transport system permease protein
MNYDFDFGSVLPELPYLLGGALVSLQIAFVAFFVGGFLGLLGALGSVYGPGAVRRSIAAYVAFFTNTPALVQVFFLYYALPDVGLLLQPMTCVLIGFVLNSAAYLSDILRAGVISVRRSELEAAQVLNMSRLQIVVHVILPHVTRTIYPPLANFFIILVLGSSLAALFGVEELTGRAINISTTNLRTIETFAAVALIYVAITFVASVSLAMLGRWAFRVRTRMF